MEGREPSCQATIRVHLWATVFNEVSIQSRPLAAFGASRAESAARPQTPDCHFRDISVAFFLSFFAVSFFCSSAGTIHSIAPCPTGRWDWRSAGGILLSLIRLE